MPTLCAFIFALASIGAAIAVRRREWGHFIVFAYLCVVSLLVYVQLPHEEQVGEGE